MKKAGQDLMVYERIRDLREDRDWTQQQVAKLLYVNRRTYSTYETGVSRMSPEILIALSKIYGTSIDYLLNQTDDPRPYKRSRG